MVTNEVDVGYKVTVSKVFEANGVADESGEFVVHPAPDSYVNANTQYLVTLDVNGVNKLYRELWTSGDYNNPYVALSDYTYITDEERIAGLSEDDVVVVRFEEVEVKTSDAFRAAVSKTAPKSEGGGSGGGVLVVHGTWSGDDTLTLDKTWQEISDSVYSVVHINEDEKVLVKPLVEYYAGDGEYGVGYFFASQAPQDNTIVYFTTSTASGYPSAVIE